MADRVLFLNKDGGTLLAWVDDRPYQRNGMGFRPPEARGTDGDERPPAADHECGDEEEATCECCSTENEAIGQEIEIEE